MGGKSGDIPDSYTTITEYPDYVKTVYQNLMNLAATYRGNIIDLSPFEELSLANPSLIWIPAGYSLADYPAVFDMYGKFIAGLDIEVLWNQIQNDSAYGAVIGEIITADSDILEDELDEQIAELFTQARSINAVMSSTFIIAEGNIRSKKLYAIAKELSDLRAKFSELAQRRWETHLNWNINVISAYLKIINDGFNLHFTYLKNKAMIDTSNLLWPFTVLDHERVIMASMHGAVSSTTKGKGGEPDIFSSILGGASSFLTSIATMAPMLGLSDIRLKKYIVAIKGIYNLIGLKYYRWEWNSLAQKLFGLKGHSQGVIAQEVLIKYPQAIVNDAGYLKVNYGLLNKILGDKL